MNEIINEWQDIIVIEEIAKTYSIAIARSINQRKWFWSGTDPQLLNC